ncbi:alpha/beta fold hydrolase [Pseudomonas sp. MS19]|uniref:RBBP9/YdeN family alpha/beta hydrolase n=1 Tax=Pseudomonas sp. MS19 TaxID=2579939 RepID=UPI001561B7D7|nr:alpha/beta fold hydrolase [Pseudomonas sp. MS19]NRH26594.1 alpha/beta hydrolase [Pseudomonas sp. MS19]
MSETTVLIIPGLRDEVPDHWQTLLAKKLERVRSVPPLEDNKLSLVARLEAIQRELDQIDGPVIIVAHSAGVLMTVHWAALNQRPIKGALLVAPPDLEAEWPPGYPTAQTLKANGWIPLPREPLPFPSILAVSSNDPLCSLQAASQMAEDWGSKRVDLGAVGHLNPAAGFGEWPEANALINQLDG